MKKSIVAIIMSTCAMLALAGCGSSTSDIDESQVILGEYKGIEVTDTGLVEVTDEDVDAVIESNLYYLTEAVEITDRAVQTNDYLSIDFVGTIDGEEFDGGTSEGYTLLIGSGTMIDGFEDGIIGMEIGETKTLELTFPEDYKEEGDESEYLNGTDVEFEVTVNTITEYVTPELTDDVIPSLSETSTTVEEYQEEIRTEYEAYYVELREESIRSEAWTQVMDNSEVVELPQEEVDELLAEIRTSYETEAETYGYEFADYISLALGMTEDEFTAEATLVAEDYVKEEIILELIAEAEGIDPSEEELNAFYEELIVDTTITTVDELKETVDEDTLEYYVLNQFVIDWIVENAVIVEAEATEEVTE